MACASLPDAGEVYRSIYDVARDLAADGIGE